MKIVFIQLAAEKESLKEKITCCRNTLLFHKEINK